MSRAICLDPSGNFNEGKGTTGWAVFDGGNAVNIYGLEYFGAIKADDYNSQEHYWNHVWLQVLMSKPDVVVCESFKLFGHKAKQQSWSEMETPQLIGYLRMMCYVNKIELVFQDPSDKIPVTDEILVKQGIFTHVKGRYYCKDESVVIHTRDAIRHGVFYHRFGKGRKV